MAIDRNRMRCVSPVPTISRFRAELAAERAVYAQIRYWLTIELGHAPRPSRIFSDEPMETPDWVYRDADARHQRRVMANRAAQLKSVP